MTRTVGRICLITAKGMIGMGFNPLGQIVNAVNDAGQFVQEKGGEVAKAATDGAAAVAKAAASGADTAMKVVSEGVDGAAKGAGKIASDVADAAKGIAGTTTAKPKATDQAIDSSTHNELADIDEDDAGKILDAIYAKTLEGIPKVSRSVDEMVADYVSKTDSPEQAAKALAKCQVMKCGTSGFVTGLGGLITLPVAIPANIGSVTYVQLRMIACIAKLGGYDLKSDQVQTMVYMCLTGTSAADVLKQAGVKTGTKTLEAAIKKIPGQVLTKINQRMGFRFITKFGEKGVINLGKIVPVVGGIIGGGVDVASTSVIAKNAIEMFINGDDIDNSIPTDGEIIEIEAIEVEDEGELI